ncbi:MAG: DUF4369 domain-containing protein [Bacteroidaceae bacterium]|nr:DUF4369 domain-containing protein [Bacteroidaceae bacterium]
MNPSRLVSSLAGKSHFSPFTLSLFTFHFSLLIAVAMLFASCSDPTRFRIRGEISNLREADFYIISTDGGLDHLDTIHVVDGSFKWQTHIDQEATFTLIFPNLSQQIIFATPGEDVKVVGDATELRAINILGTDENEDYTQFRIDHFYDKPKELIAAMQGYIDQHPGSRVSDYMRRHIALLKGENNRLVTGKPLPAISLPPDGLSSDSTTITLHPHHPILLVFWASWDRSSIEDFYNIVKLYHQSQHQPDPKRAVQAIGISLDVNPQEYASVCRYDSVLWDSRCYRLSWSTPIVEQLSIRELPYYILTDDQLKVIAHGSKWKENIAQPLWRLTSRER